MNRRLLQCFLLALAFTLSPASGQVGSSRVRDLLLSETQWVYVAWMPGNEPVAGKWDVKADAKVVLENGKLYLRLEHPIMGPYNLELTVNDTGFTYVSPATGEITYRYQPDNAAHPFKADPKFGYVHWLVKGPV